MEEHRSSPAGSEARPMEMLLEVGSGEDAGRRIAVLPGGGLTVGRQPPAEALLPSDSRLSGEHFRIEFGPAGVRVRDLGSRFGTQVNGQDILDAPLTDGDEIRAGRTVFRVHLSGAPAANPAAAVLAPNPVSASAAPSGTGNGATPVPLNRVNVTVQLRRLDGPLYAILDAAREPTIPNRLVASAHEHASLYDGPDRDTLAPFGPWLVNLPPGSTLLDELVTEGWGQSWGVFLTCPASLEAVRAHLRRFLIAKLPDGRQAYFRYYDPRVLRTYLPNCTPDEVRAFLGPVGVFAVEGETGEDVLAFSAADRAWRPAG